MTSKACLLIDCLNELVDIDISFGDMESLERMFHICCHYIQYSMHVTKFKAGMSIETKLTQND